MRYPVRHVIRSRESRVCNLPSPVGGLNARDPIAKMPPTDALTLTNFRCTPFDVEVRKGYTINNAGAPTAVNALASYEAPTGGPTLFAWSDGNVYDCTDNIGVVGAPVISGNQNSLYNTINFGTAAGVFLVAVNGADLPLLYNGTVWSNAFDAPFNTTVTSLTSVGTTATATMVDPHHLKTGMSVTVSGFTPAGYNGTYVITVTGASTFTYTLATPEGLVTVTGTIAPTLNVSITGVDPSRFIQIAAFKFRLWFVEKESSKVWYLPVSSLGGAASSIDFTTLFTKGGYLVAMTNWSLDAGYGIDDYAAFISSNGQVCVFRGTDPSSSSTWELVGVYDIGAPIGRKCFQKFAGDVTLICEDGLVLLSKALMSTRVNLSPENRLTDKIQDLVSTYTTNYGQLFGWEVILFPRENMLLLNIPVSSTLSYQFVMNTISGSWSSFDSWNAHCWVLHDNELYFGGENFVAKAWNTNSDNGDNINFEGQQAFSYCGSRLLKKVNMVRPIISTNGTPNINMGVNVDYDTSDPIGTPTFNPITTAVWDVSLWDVGTWAGDLSINKNWQTAVAVGYALSPHLKGATNNIAVSWEATDLMVADGGLL